MSSLENCLISTYLLWFSTRVQMEKNWGDTPSATLIWKFIMLMLLVVVHAEKYQELINMSKNQQPIDKVKSKGHIHEHAHV